MCFFCLRLMFVFILSIPLPAAPSTALYLIKNGVFSSKLFIYYLNPTVSFTPNKSIRQQITSTCFFSSVFFSQHNATFAWFHWFNSSELWQAISEADPYNFNSYRVRPTVKWHHSIWMPHIWWDACKSSLLQVQVNISSADFTMKR